MTLTASSFRPRTIWREVQSIRQFCDNRLGWLLDLSQTVGDFGTYRFGHWQGVMVNSSELAHALLVEHADAFHKPQVFRFLKTLIGNGLLTSDGEEWRSQRHLAAPAFQHRRIAAYAQVIANYAEQAQAEWHDGAKIDVVNEMMRLTLRIAGKTLFDTDVLGDTEEIGVALGAALHYIDQQGSRLLAPPPSWPTPANLRHRKTIARLDAIVARMIAERRASGEDKGDLLSMLLAVRDEGNGAGMTDRQVRDEAMTLLLAGHETTAIVLAWSLVLLARHPHIYARLRDEACAALCGRTPTFEDLPKLPYALQVFKEAMRLYPPVYVTARSATRDVELCGRRIAKGTLVLLSPYTMHRRPEYFAAPERFDPERFAPEGAQRWPRHAYIPFGGGRRICIGNHFALMQGQLILATLAQRLALQLAPSQRVAADPRLTLRPKGRITMTARR